MRFIRNELVSLKDMGFLRGKFEEVNWKTVALKNIMLLKDKIKVIDIFISRLRKFGHVIFELNIFFDLVRRKKHRHTNIFLQ